MSQYNLHPVNSVVQQMTAQPVQLGQSLPPMLDYHPSGLELRQPVGMDETIDNIRTQVEGPKPVQLGAVPAADTPVENPAPNINQQLGNVYQQMAAYQPYGQKHPYMMQLANLVNQRAGLSPMYNDSGLSVKDQMNLMALKRQADALSAIKQMQQTAAANKVNIGIYNALAPNAGLPAATPGSVIDDKQIGTVQALVQKFGAPAYAKAANEYNLGLQNYKTAQADLHLWNDRKARGLLTPDQIKAGPPVVPEPPVFNIEGINPFLDAGSVAGITGTSGEAANTGINTALEPSKDVTAEQQAKVEEDKLQHQLIHDNQEIDLARQKANEDTRHNTVSEGIQQTQADTSAENVGSQIEQRRKALQIDALKVQQNTEKNWLDTTDRFLKQRYGVDSKGNVKAPKPGSPDYEAYQVLQTGIARRQQKLRDIADQITQTATEQPVHEQKPVVAATGQRLNQSAPTIKGSSLLKNLAKRYNIH